MEIVANNYILCKCSNKKRTDLCPKCLRYEHIHLCRLCKMGHINEKFYIDAALKMGYTIYLDDDNYYVVQILKYE